MVGNGFDFFRNLVETTDDLVAKLDNQGRFVYVSPSAERIFGVPPSQCIGKRALRFVHPEDRRNTLAKFALWLKNKTTKATLENRQLNLAGHVYHMMWTINFNYNGAGSIIDTIYIGRDITRMKKAEDELRRSEEMWNKLFMASPTWIVLATLEGGYFLDCNDAFSRDTGYAKEEVMGRTTIEVGLWPDPQDRGRTLEIIQQKGGLDKFPVKLRMRDGEIREFLWSTVIQRVKGEACLLSVLVDVSDLKQTQEKLAAINQELELRSMELSETNAALKVLLKQRDEDKKDLESRVWHNIKKMIMPHLFNLRQSGLNNTQQAHLDVVVGRLGDIASGLGQKLGYHAYGLTARELEIVGHIVEGKTNKDIADILCISVHSVESHRFSIRKKLGLLGKKKNLRAHLLALSQ